MTVTTIIISLIAVGLIGWGITIYNRLVALKEQTSNTFANIDVILKQRAEQIPQLVTVLEKSMEHERDIFTRLSDARQGYLNANTLTDKIKASNEMNNAFRSVLAVAENYPTLISGSQFSQLQTSVTDLENKIAHRREMFNDAVTEYNTAIYLFPDLIFARMFHYQRLPLLEISQAEKAYDGIKFK
ncbi:LemA family protein [Photorhabdus luminescens]|uniref:LemA family protein n=1 Tax=Photorhabdus akhurstii TaxID=171438 RepID=UPI000CF98F6E|nr:LemA family protein [Photorhabdus luminescens]